MFSCACFYTPWANPSRYDVCICVTQYNAFAAEWHATWLVRSHPERIDLDQLKAAGMRGNTH